VVTEALGLVREYVTLPLLKMAAARPPTPARAVVAKVFARWRRFLEESGYLDGCPVVATVTDAAANDTLRDAARDTFVAWEAALVTALHRGGLTPARARRMAALTITSLEGAIAVSRARRDLEVFDTVAAELDRLLR
jgi:hypothetical protein